MDQCQKPFKSDISKRAIWALAIIWHQFDFVNFKKKLAIPNRQTKLTPS